MKKLFYVFAVLIVALSAFSPSLFSADTAQASVMISSEYHATTTGATYGIANVKVIKRCLGGNTLGDAPCPTTLGSVVVTEAGAAGGHINFYNATTSNVNLRTGNKATSTILIASIPNNATVGTYTFDVVAPTGLLVVYDGSATVATTTITYR